MLSENVLAQQAPAETIHREVVHEAIGTAAQHVLETMYFTMLEEEARGQLPLAPTPTMRVQLTFSGEWAGSFFVETSAKAAREVAANFTGLLNAEDVGDQTAGEVLGEMANMVCGSILSFLGRQKLFDLSSPKITYPASPAPDGVPVGLQVERTFILDGGTAIRFAIASAAFRP